MSNLNPDQLNTMLSIITSNNPDNQEIKKATECIKKYTENNINCVEGLLYQMKMNSNGRVKQLASLILYKVFDKFWKDIEIGKQELIKNLLIELYSKEKEFLVLKGIANLMYKICSKILLTSPPDDPLIKLIFSNPEKYSIDQTNLFELNLYILARLVSNGDVYGPKIDSIKNILHRAFYFGLPKMIEKATQCLSKLIISQFKAPYMEFQKYIPVICENLINFSENGLLKIFETFYDYDKDSLYFFQDHYNLLVTSILKVILNQEFSINLKSMLSEFLFLIAKNTSKVYTNNDCELLKSSIEVAFYLLSSLENGEEDIFNDYSLFNIGCRIINCLSVIIPSKKIFPLLLGLIQNKHNSNKECERIACITIIIQMTEGCKTDIKDILPEIIKLIFDKFNNDSSDIVKGQCILSLELFTKYCEPDIYDYYKDILPMIITGIYNPNDKIVEKSLYMIDIFFQNIDNEAEENFNMSLEINKKLFEKLILLLENNKPEWILVQCLDALKTIIGCGKNIEQNLLIRILEDLKQLTLKGISNKNEKYIGSALCCVAQIMTITKKENFIPYENYFVSFALECIKSNIYDLQFGGMYFFGFLAQNKKETLSPIIDMVMKNAFNIMKDDTDIMAKDTKKDEYKFDSDSEFSQEDDLYYFNEDTIEAKTATIKAVGEIAKNLPVEFSKYFSEFQKILEEGQNHVCEDIVIQVIQGYEDMIYFLDKIGMPIMVDEKEITLDSFWINEAFTAYNDIYNNTDSIEVYTQIFESLYMLIKKYEKRLFPQKHIMDIYKNFTNRLLNPKDCYSIKINKEDKEDISDNIELFGSIKNFLIILAEIFEDDFDLYFTETGSYLLKYLKTDVDESQRSLVFGLFAEVFKYSKTSVKLYIKRIFEEIEKNIKCEKISKNNEELLRHISYLIGIFFESNKEASLPFLEKSLNILECIFNKTIKDGKENVLASLARIIKSMGYNKQNFLYFEKSVEKIMKSIPFKYNREENLTILEFFEYLKNIFNLDDFKKYLEPMMLLIKDIVVNENKYKIGNTPEEIEKIQNQNKKVYFFLNGLTQNAKLKEMIKDFISNKLSPEEQKLMEKRLYKNI